METLSPWLVVGLSWDEAGVVEVQGEQRGMVRSAAREGVHQVEAALSPVETLKYRDITGKIIGAAFEVHKFLANGFQEVICQRALAYEMYLAGLSFAQEIEQDIPLTLNPCNPVIREIRDSDSSDRRT